MPKPSKTATRLRHCSKCGKFSKHPTGEYTRKDGSAGYINQEEGEAALACSDCREESLHGEVISMEPLQGSLLSEKRSPVKTKPKAKKKVEQSPSSYWTIEDGKLVKRQRVW